MKQTQQIVNKFLFLEFKNAGFFKKHKRTKDKIFDLSSTRNRKDEEEFEEPITYFQVSNILHVLFGERPVPSIRESLYSRNEYLVQKSLNSYIKINSYNKD
jgi:hypothetical protein